MLNLLNNSLFLICFENFIYKFNKLRRLLFNQTIINYLLPAQMGRTEYSHPPVNTVLAVSLLSVRSSHILPS